MSRARRFRIRHLQMLHPDRVVDAEGFASLPLLDPIYPPASTSALEPGAQGRGFLRWRLPVLPEWQDEVRLYATRIQILATRCAPSIVRNSSGGYHAGRRGLGRGSLTTNFWRAVALALLRPYAHRADGQRRRGWLRARIIAALPMR